MAEYITKEEAISAFEWGDADVIEDYSDGCEFGFSRGSIKSMINSIPAADVVPVVRCKDCEHSYDDIVGRICAYGSCVDCVVEDDFYCKNGSWRGNLCLRVTDSHGASRLGMTGGGRAESSAPTRENRETADCHGGV